MQNIRYIKRIDTGNKTNEYIDGQTIDFILPRNKVDLSSFKIYYDVYIDPVYRFAEIPVPAIGGAAQPNVPETYLKRFMPRLSSSIIETITITKNANIIQEIKDYNVLFNILNDSMREEDNLDSNKPDTLNVTLVSDANIPGQLCDFCNLSAPESIREPLTYKYFISSFLGLINEGTSGVLDCTKNEYKISIKLAPKYITYRGLDVLEIDITDVAQIAEKYPDDYHYRLSNVFANIDVLPESTLAPQKISFKHYDTVRGTETHTKDITLSYTHKGEIDYLISSFIVLGHEDTGLQLEACNEDEIVFDTKFKLDYPTFDDFVDTPFSVKYSSSKAIKTLVKTNNLNNSLYFSRQALNLRSSQYFINGQAITPSMDIPEIYGQAKEFFNNLMTRVKCLASFESEFFVFPISIEQNEKDYCTTIEWQCTAGDRTDFATTYDNNGDVYPIMFISYNKEIDV